jgi:hypothetical protein
MKAVRILPGWYSVTWIEVVRKSQLRHHAVMVKARSKWDATMQVLDQLIELNRERTA